MIAGFSCKETEKVWKGERSRRWDNKVVKVAIRKLFMLHAANNLNDLRIPPSNRLHSLKDDLKGYHSISINMQWRIALIWKEDHTINVSIIAYH